MADFKEHGAVWFHQCRPGGKVLVRFNLKGQTPGSTHACHIHTFGDMTGGCMTAGSHYNPHGEKHGNKADDGKHRHAGDMMNNITAGADGTVSFDWWDELLNLFQKDILGAGSIVGRTVVIHEGVDDLGRGGTPLSEETGNAGGRMMCAVIGLTGTAIRHVRPSEKKEAR